ncbi:hypothetical protein GKQ77_01800 [Streptomyces sp. BG9H]|uniref:Uncharacterized protein n=1 Tax=Streptomyces anatolicus TaxID=2675858 RepID=A0ABS6YFW5_9ACTN|nr:hypothetical protein [Streptomyces anatolicus]MBW5420305.1 hypothetical protein [Streptomyces anatolicus]
MKPTRVEIMGDDGEWHDVLGVASIELHEEQPDTAADPWVALAARVRATQAERDALVREAWTVFARAYVEAMRPAMEQAAAAMAEFNRAVKASATAKRDDFVLHTDRPAWQSPYGPPTRRH